MRKFFNLSAALFFMLTLAGCSKRTDVSLGWFYWRTDVRFDEQDKNILSTFGTERLYTRFFDVAYDTGQRTVTPLAPANIHSLPGSNCIIVPVVYITVDALSHADARTLSHAIVARVTIMAKDAGIAGRFDEIELDSDWTAKTKDIYFDILRETKRIGSAATPPFFVSSTIRLHQIKYKKAMGVPPADRLMLMLYNLRSPHEFSMANSMYDAPTAERYLSYIADYPFPLDYALPVFSQCRQYGSRSNFIRLMNDVTERDIPACTVRIAPHVYRATADIMLRNYRVMKNDILALDGTDLSTALAAARSCYRSERRSSPAQKRIVLYHFDHDAREFAPDAVSAFTNAIRRR